MKMVKPC